MDNRPLTKGPPQVNETVGQMFAALREQGPSRYSLAILQGMQGKHVYQGTVSDSEIATRRRRNRAARRSRRINRGHR